jgi:4'-phosphopantetheinyl transferase
LSAGLDMVEVRWAAPSEWADGAEPCGWLDEVEARRRGELRRSLDRLRFTVSRHLLKTLVGELAGVPAASVRLGYDCGRCGRAHGRPVVIGPAAAVGCWVSIAHAADRVVVAASDAGPVGVDVEPVAAVDFDGFDDVALSGTERASLAALEPGLRAAARAGAWVGKEARLKATGEGLRVDPADSDGRDWAGGMWPLDVGPGYAAAVATLSGLTREGPVGSGVMSDSGRGAQEGAAARSRRARSAARW